MIFAIIGALLGSAGASYLIGFALAAPRGSFMRTKRGMLLAVIVGLTLIPLPPQLPSLGDAADSLGSVSSGLSALAWPEGLGVGVYLVLWAVTSIAALLVGIRIWQLGTPDWRSGAGRAVDASAASRAVGLLPLADRVEDALDVLKRSGLGPRDVPQVAEAVRAVGRRFADSLPPSDGEVYRLVSACVPASVASSITGLLLEGAGRRGAR